jgi:CheY-like chemotaxis protein
LISHKLSILIDDKGKDLLNEKELNLESFNSISYKQVSVESAKEQSDGSDRMNNSNFISAIDDIKEVEEDFMYTCLIANDDPLQLAILEAIFEKNQFKVTTTING